MFREAKSERMYILLHKVLFCSSKNDLQKSNRPGQAWLCSKMYRFGNVFLYTESPVNMHEPLRKKPSNLKWSAFNEVGSTVTKMFTIGA